MSLRLRLLTGLAALVVVGVAVFGTTTYLSVEHVLGNTLNGQLTDAARGLGETGLANNLGTATANPLSPEDQFGHSGPFGNQYGQGAQNIQGNDEITARNAAGPQFFVEFLNGSGTPIEKLPASVRPEGAQPVIPPSVVSHVTSQVPASQGSSRQPPPTIPVQLMNASPAGGGAVERVAVAYPAGGGAVVVAASLASVSHTLHSLLEVEVAVGLAVLALSFGLGLALARQATRPLEEIAATADAIAAGDMDRRVSSEDVRSEAGRVALALNAMLARIQEAFARRDATEARLRTFVADASHELSTPLTSIRGYAELFHRGLAERPEDLAKALGRIESEATRMGVLVDDLLVLASFDAGRPLHQDPVDLRRIVTDAAFDLQAVDPDRPVAVEAAGPVIVLGDESRLRQVAANLISNVRRHTPAGTPVTIRAHRDAGGAMGVLEVADRGPGMTPEQASHVFDRFYRVDKARSRAMGGAGLGLSIVASIAEAHGGSASVSTAMGSGTTFSVAIPVARATDPAPNGRPTPPPTAAGAGAGLAG
jgi:two-component system OmpR family sensor kinase